VIRTLKQQNPDRVPRDLWLSMWVEEVRIKEVNDVLMKYPLDFLQPDFVYGAGERERGQVGRKGAYVDAWGCVWQAGESGVIGEVKEPPLADWSNLDHYRLPWEVLKNADLSSVNKQCYETERFTLLRKTNIKPFERLQHLRGTEQLFLDFGYGTKEIYRLRDMLHEYFMTEVEMWARTDIDAVTFFDDWGSQTNLLVSPDFWREMYKPLYKEICDLLHSYGKYVFFHSDGNIAKIYADLIELKIDAINSQLFCMDIEDIGAQFKGKITFWGEIDRQHVLPYGTPDEARQAVKRVKKSLFSKVGGVIAQCFWSAPDPKVNIEAVFDEWNSSLL
jgi:hypothetical protein